jgi:hypothetical protein
MDHYSYLIDREHRFLLIGIILVVMAVVFTLTGETLERYHGIVYRAEEPKRTAHASWKLLSVSNLFSAAWFWWNVATFYFGGAFFIGLFLYKN